MSAEFDRFLRVLAALTDRTATDWANRLREGWTHPAAIVDWLDAYPWQGLAGWRTHSTAEALELLIAAELLPASWVGDPARTWCCLLCNGRGTHGGVADAESPETCRPCEGTGRCEFAPSIPVLVRWASVSPDVTLQREELAREGVVALHEYGLPRGPRRILGRFERRETYNNTIPLTWIAPGGTGVTLYDCLDVRGVWWPGHGDPSLIPALGALWERGGSLDKVFVRTGENPVALDLVLAFQDPLPLLTEIAESRIARRQNCARG